MVAKNATHNLSHTSAFNRRVKCASVKCVSVKRNKYGNTFNKVATSNDLRNDQLANPLSQ